MGNQATTAKNVVPKVADAFKPFLDLGEFFLPQQGMARFSRKRKRNASSKSYRSRKRTSSVRRKVRIRRKRPSLKNRRRSTGGPRTVFPRMRKISFVSHHVQQHTVDAAVLNWFTINPLNLIDPWANVGSEQGRGLDQVGRIYKRFVVIGAVWSVQLTILDGGTRLPMYLSHGANREGKQFTDLRQIQEVGAPWAMKNSTFIDRDQVYRFRQPYAPKKVNKTLKSIMTEKGYHGIMPDPANSSDGLAPVVKDELKLYFQIPSWATSANNCLFQLDMSMTQTAIVFDNRHFGASDDSA